MDAIETGYSQRDPRWATARLGTSSKYTIGNAGCLITATAEMLRRMYLRATDPGMLNRWLTNNGGYAEGYKFVFNAIERLPRYPVHLVELIDCTDRPAPTQKILDYLRETTELGPYLQLGILLRINMTPYGADSEHWVLATELHGIHGETDIAVVDPWIGQEITLMTGPYGRPDWDIARMVYRIAVYRVGERP